VLQSTGAEELLTANDQEAVDRVNQSAAKRDAAQDWVKAAENDDMQAQSKLSDAHEAARAGMPLDPAVVDQLHKDAVLANVRHHYAVSELGNTTIALDKAAAAAGITPPGYGQTVPRPGSEAPDNKDLLHDATNYYLQKQPLKLHLPLPLTGDASPTSTIPEVIKDEGLEVDHQVFAPADVFGPTSRGSEQSPPLASTDVHVDEPPVGSWTHLTGGETPPVDSSANRWENITLPEHSIVEDITSDPPQPDYGVQFVDPEMELPRRRTADLVTSPDVAEQPPAAAETSLVDRYLGLFNELEGWVKALTVLTICVLFFGTIAFFVFTHGSAHKSTTAASTVMYEQLTSSAVSTLDPSTCNMNLDYVWKIIGDAAPLEGKTATATATGPGLQHTYTTTVKGGQMEFKATAPGSAWSTGPGNGCSSASGQGWELKLATVGNLHAADGILR
jgi:hypothetical protein